MADLGDRRPALEARAVAALRLYRRRLAEVEEAERLRDEALQPIQHVLYRMISIAAAFDGPERQQWIEPLVREHHAAIDRFLHLERLWSQACAAVDAARETYMALEGNLGYTPRPEDEAEHMVRLH